MNKQTWLMGGALLLAAVPLASAAHSDVKYTEATTMEMPAGRGGPGGMGGMGISLSSTTAAREGARRIETNINMGPLKMQTLEVELCDKQLRLQIDPAQKIYAESPLADKPAGMMGNLPFGGGMFGGPGGRGGRGRPPADTGPKGTGKMIITTDAQDLGEEEVAGVKTRHWTLAVRTQSSGCAGDADTTIKMEAWTAPGIAGAASCPVKSQTQTPPEARYLPPHPNCDITYERHGDDAGVLKLFGGLMMRLKVYDKDGQKVMMTREVTSFSEAKLNDVLFAPPADFKKVTPAEYQQAQQQAMMRAFMGGMGGNQ